VFCGLFSSILGVIPGRNEKKIQEECMELARRSRDGAKYPVAESIDSSEIIRDGGLVVKTLEEAYEKILAYQLRYRVFHQELGWVPRRESQLETDEYDNHATSFGVFDNERRLLAYMRLIKPEVPYMLEKEFSAMVGPEHEIRKESDTVELSRLCVAPEVRSDRISGNFGVGTLSLLLYKGVYHWCMAHAIRYLYLVVEKKVFRMVRAGGFPCKLVGEPVIMPDGVEAVAAILDWRDFEELNRRKRPEMLRWFLSGQSDPLQHRWQRPAPCSLRPISFSHC
jgi:acyl homoserine lactone synthase